jgi:hypothetical protein
MALRIFQVNKGYFSKSRGYLRIAIIIALLGGWIAAAVIAKDSSVFSNGFPSTYAATRIAALIILISGFATSIIIFLLNFLLVKGLPTVPWTIIV